MPADGTFPSGTARWEKRSISDFVPHWEPDLCIQCGNCKEICPAKIDIPELIMEIRRRLVEKDGLPLLQKAVYSVVNNRRLFHGMLRAASLAALAAGLVEDLGDLGALGRGDTEDGE